jgi:hypothetical protein
MLNNLKGKKMTNELKETYDSIYKKMEGGTAHKQFRSENVSQIEADDNFARFVMETAKSVIKFNKRGK